MRFSEGTDLVKPPQICSGGATIGRDSANALTEIRPLWLPPWQSKGVIIKLYFEDILTALAGASNHLSAFCHEQRTGAATANMPMAAIIFLITDLSI